MFRHPESTCRGRQSRENYFPEAIDIRRRGLRLSGFPTTSRSSPTGTRKGLTVEEILGLKTGDAHIIRNAGGIVTEDAIRSFVISHHLLGTREFMIVNHTDCGMLTFKDAELVETLNKKTGKAAVAPAHFHSFADLDENVRRQAAKLRDHPWIPPAVPIRGFVFDVKTGKLREVK
jgi:carbonic anhydrase